MNYTLHQLQVFLKVTQTQSITKAAEELHLTQPAVSIQLKNLQDQFDIPLTELIGRKIYITDFGREIALAAEQILEHVNQINYKTSAYKGQLAGRLKLSVVSTGKYVIPYFLSDFLQANPGIELELDVTNKAKVIESLQNNEVDFSLITVLPDNLELNSLVIMPNQLHVVVGSQLQPQDSINPAIPSASYASVSPSEEILQTLPLIYREAGSGTRYVMEKFIKENSLPIRKKMELTSNEAVKQAVIAGLGYSIMPLVGIKNELSLGQLCIVPKQGFPLHSAWQLVWLKTKKLSSVAASYQQFIQVNKDRIASDKFGWLTQFNAL